MSDMSDMSTVSLEPYSNLTSLLILPSYSSTYHILPHIFPYLLLLPATNSSLSPIPSSFTFLHVQLLVYHDTTGLSLLSAPHPSVYTLFLSSTLTFLLSTTPLLAVSLPLPSLFSLLL